ncbi:MAG: ATP-binding protein [Oscillospiraceae bacterium]
MEMPEHLRAGIAEARKKNTASPYENYEQYRCDNYNAGVGKLEGYDCPKCKNKGDIALLNADNVQVVRECECMKIRKSQLNLKKSGIAQQIERLTFDNFEATQEWQKTIKKAAERFTENVQGWFYIGGQSGAGKTHLCTAITGKLIAQGREARYMLWRDSVVQLKQVAMDGEYRELIGDFKNVQVLYIDDLFKTERGKSVTRADIAIAFELINYRYMNERLITIISSELTTNELIGIDEATAGRIVELSKPNGCCFNLKQDRSKNYRLRD